MPGKRKTEEDYCVLAKRHRFEWIGKNLPKNTHAKTLWRCPQGHEWKVPYNRVQQGIGCPYCSNKAPKTTKDYCKLAEEKGFEWLGEGLPQNVMVKTSWQCLSGHKWETPYHSIDSGSGCPYCAGRAKKVPEDYRALADEKGFKWVGPFPKDTNHKTWWKCQEGHKWHTTHRGIQSGRGCPHCYRKRKLKVADDYYALAEERGFNWLGPFPQTTKHKTQWQCSRGHKWKAPYSSIGQGIGCPYCAGKARRTSVDYHAVAKENGIEWLGPFPDTVLDKTSWRCQDGHKWEAPYNSIQQGRGCLQCYEADNRLTSCDYKMLAQKYGFIWIGPLPPSNKVKTVWECAKGHQWKTRYSDIQRGFGCPDCAGRTPKTEEDYYLLADTMGFEWIGSLPQNTGYKTLWRCPEGHEWEAAYSMIHSRGTGCPHCVSMFNGRHYSKVQKQLCEMVNGELNHPLGSYCIDIALVADKIAIEYDSWYWHGNRLDADNRRDKELIGAGWRVLHVRSNNGLPTEDQLNVAISQLQLGKTKTEIVLDDWGRGPVFSGV